MIWNIFVVKDNRLNPSNLEGYIVNQNVGKNWKIYLTDGQLIFVILLGLGQVLVASYERIEISVLFYDGYCDRDGCEAFMWLFISSDKTVWDRKLFKHLYKWDFQELIDQDIRFQSRIMQAGS